MAYGLRVCWRNVTISRIKKAIDTGLLRIHSEHSVLLQTCINKVPSKSTLGAWLTLHTPISLQNVTKIEAPPEVRAIEFLLHPEGGETTLVEVEQEKRA
jgi:hypothetical protein